MLAKLYPYDSTAPELFAQAKEKIKKILPNAEIEHVGSTAIPELGGKGMIDILIAIPDWQEKAGAVKTLGDLGFTHVNPERGDYIFLSKVGETKKNDIHLHLTSVGSAEYHNLLDFRNYLLVHPDEVGHYATLKETWLKDAGGDRKHYGHFKNDYITNLLNQSK